MDEETRSALWKQQRINRKANNLRIALANQPNDIGRIRVKTAWNPVAQAIAERGKTEPEEYDSDRGNFAGERR